MLNNYKFEKNMVINYVLQHKSIIFASVFHGIRFKVKDYSS